ncbi:MAG: serine/threonine-protein kinase [Desulforhopalus sp.]
MSETKNAPNVMFETGTIIDEKWVILDLIGRGAMGEVYRAHQTNLKRDVAIKVISEAVLNEAEDDPQELKIAFGRFEREVQTMARVRHTNILTIYDYIENGVGGDDWEGKTAFIVMEYIPGNSLRFTMVEEGLDDVPEEYAKWLEKYFLPVLDGVEVLHNNGIVHRDLKPENIFMDGEAPKIADFGLARSRHMKAVTTSIEMLGTLAYMSPEQSADFKNAGFATDIYALGKILYEAVHGMLTEKTLPFTSVSLETTESMFLNEISKVIEKATAVSPAERFHIVPELRSALLKSLSIHREELLQNLQGELPVTGGPIKNDGHGSLKSLAVSLAILIAIVGIGGAYYFGRNFGPSSGLDDNTYSNHDESLLKQKGVIVTTDQKAATTISGLDGSRMVLTGDLERDGSTTPFYLDKQQVTNFMFVEFLNSIRDELSVKDGIVRKGNTIVSYIGTGPEHTEAIIYEHDKFHLKEQEGGSKPVVRVTFHGAHLYASHYDKELLSSREWEFAYQFHHVENVLGSSNLGQSEEQNSTGMMHTIPVDRSTEINNDTLGGMGKGLKEWVNISGETGQDGTSQRDHSFVAGVIDESTIARGRLPAKRAPWEGFDDVGFRTKMDIITK